MSRQKAIDKLIDRALQTFDTDNPLMFRFFKLIADPRVSVSAIECWLTQWEKNAMYKY